MNFSKIQQYLPSKKFQKIIGAVLIVVILILGINFIVSGRESFKNKDILAVNNKTIYEIRDTDTDYDGVYDWEETLWGTDKEKKFTFDGIADYEYIQNKKKALNTEGEINLREITETEKFAQEFFSTFVALQNTEGVDPSDINNFSDALGQNLVSQEIPDSYTLSQVKTTRSTDADSQIDYYIKVQELFQNAQTQGLGNELEITSQNLVSYTNQGKTTNINELILIGQTYIDFASKMMQITVPINLQNNHLDIANASNSVGKSVLNMAKVTEDPVVGLSAVANYQKYSQELVDSVNSLEKELEKVL